MLVPSERPVAGNTETLDELRVATGRFFSDPAARTDPATFYSRLVRNAPILHLGPMWLVSGFDELSWLSGRGELRSFPSVRGQVFPLTLVPSLAKSLALMLPLRDGPEHRELKGLATATFSSSRIDRLQPLIEGSLDAILDRAIGRGEMDVVTDLALPLPVAISTAILDIPDGDRSQVREWAMLVRSQSFRYSQDTADIDFVEAELREFATFVRSLCETRRRRPGEDLISDLASAADAGQLSVDELVAYILMLFVNGLDTLTAGITMGIWELLQHPGERAAVATDRDHAKAMFGETIRLHSPVRFSARTLIADVELDGHRLREGEVVALFYSAANRDPRRFPAPDRFDPMRERRRHLGFGHGAHHCLGAPLSLVAGAIVLERIAQLGDKLTTDVTPATMAWNPALTYNTLESLPLRVSLDESQGT